MPALRYRNVAAAIDWLCTAFGFEKHHVVTGDDGSILYVHLTLGNDMIIVRSVRDSPLDQLMKQPDEIGGAETQSCYFVVDDADAHCRNAKATGAEIVLDINDDGHGGRGYLCRDPEGHIWSFGTYDPWQRNPTTTSLRSPSATRGSKKLNRPVLLTAMLVSISAGVAAGWMLPQLVSDRDENRLKHDAIAGHQRAAQELARANLLAAELVQERGAKDAAERAAHEARDQLVHEQGAKTIAERNARQLEEQLTEERRAKDVAERTAKDARGQIAMERAAQEAAQRITSDTVKDLALERDAKQRAERATQDALKQLAREGRAKENAERAAKEAREQLAEAQTAKKGIGRPAGNTQQGQNAKKAPAQTLDSSMPSLRP